MGGITLSPPPGFGETRDEKKMLEAFVNAMSAAKEQVPNEETKDPQEKPQEEEKPKDVPEIVKIWNSEVDEIRKKLSLEDLIFNGFVTAPIEMFNGLLTVTFKSLEYEVLGEILKQIVSDKTDDPLTNIKNDHSLMLMSEALIDIKAKSGSNFPELPTSRNEKFAFLGQMNSYVTYKILEKYNQFDSAVKLLTSDEKELSLIEKLKK